MMYSHLLCIRFLDRYQNRAYKVPRLLFREKENQDLRHKERNHSNISLQPPNFINSKMPGCTHCNFTGRRKQTCSSCAGTCRTPGPSQACLACNAQGRLPPNGIICQVCNGRGSYEPPVPCTMCNAQGQVDTWCPYCHGHWRNSSCGGSGSGGC